MSAHELPPSASGISLLSEDAQSVIVIQQGGFTLLRVVVAAAFSLFLLFPGRDMGFLDLLLLVRDPSLFAPAMVFTGAFGILMVWMIIRALQRPRPQRWVLDSGQLTVDWGLPALRMVSNGQPFDRRWRLVFPHRKPLSVTREACNVSLERLSPHEHRLWLQDGDKRVELAPWVSEPGRLWLHATLARWSDA
ncbi:MAG: hypothetical protein LAT63_05595 [Marinobacter sp.]|nr:hypothetical protein [Marinobacter sp.]